MCELDLHGRPWQTNDRHFDVQPNSCTNTLSENMRRLLRPPRPAGPARGATRAAATCRAPPGAATQPRRRPSPRTCPTEATARAGSGSRTPRSEACPATSCPAARHRLCAKRSRKAERNTLPKRTPVTTAAPWLPPVSVRTFIRRPGTTRVARPPATSSRLAPIAVAAAAAASALCTWWRPGMGMLTSTVPAGRTKVASRPARPRSAIDSARAGAEEPASSENGRRLTPAGLGSRAERGLSSG